MTAADTCWADRLSRAERRVLSERLARACKLSWHTAQARTPRSAPIALDLNLISVEMSDLHLDVTERAEVPPAIPRMTNAELDADLAGAEEREDWNRVDLIEAEQEAREMTEPHEDTPSLEDRGLHLGSYAS